MMTMMKVTIIFHDYHSGVDDNGDGAVASISNSL